MRLQRAKDKQLYGQFIKRGDLVFDIGANVGQTSEIFLALGAKTVAVEPNPICCAVIDAGIGKADDLVLVRKAVGSEAGEAKLTFSHTDAIASLKEDWHGLRHASGPLEHAVVEVTTLDQLIRTYGTPVFCKIDVEGFELEVVNGLTSKIRVLTLEFFKSDTDQIRECLDRLSAIGSIEVNLIEMDSPSLFLKDWLKVEDLMTFLDSPSCPSEGDLFIRFQG